MGERLEHARKARGLTPPQLAKTVGVSRAVVGQWERGRSKNIKNKHMIRLCDALQINERWLVTGEGPRDAPHSPEMAREFARWLAIYEGLNPEQRKILVPLLEATIEAQNRGLLPSLEEVSILKYLPSHTPKS